MKRFIDFCYQALTGADGRASATRCGAFAAFWAAFVITCYSVAREKDAIEYVAAFLTFGASGLGFGAWAASNFFRSNQSNTPPQQLQP